MNINCRIVRIPHILNNCKDREDLTGDVVEKKIFIRPSIKLKVL